jgi:hypothetical protein
MAKHIRKEFQYDLPDEYLSNESTLGLKAQWTYDGPEKIWVFVDYKTNKILARESFREYDEENPEAQYEFLEVYTGFNSYPVVISFDDDPLLLSAIAQIAPEMKDLPTKKYFHPETKELFYERPHPTVPDHTIEIADCEYDPKLKRWKKPYPWKIPHIIRQEFEYNHKIILEDAVAIQSRYEENEWTEDQRAKWDAFVLEMQNVPTKFAPWIETPWMIPFPDDPRLDPEWKDFVDADPESGNIKPPDPQPKVINEGALVNDDNGAYIVVSSPTEKSGNEGTGETLVSMGTTSVFNITPPENETDEEAGRMPGMTDWSKVSPPALPVEE